MGIKRKRTKCIFQAKHANMTLGYGKRLIEFKNYRYETSNQEEIELLKKACKNSDPISKIYLIQEIDLAQDPIDESPEGAFEEAV